MKRKLLIDGWWRGYRLSSVQAALVLVLLNMAQAEVLPLFSFAIPAQAMLWINAVLGLVIMVFRHLAQPDALKPPRRLP